MKLSPNTIEVLKSFSTINPSILVKPGNVLQTIAPGSRSIFAKVTVAEDFPQQFAIHELPQFLGVLSLFKDPDITFSEHNVVVEAPGQSVTYQLAEPSMVVAPPDRELTLPDNVFEFTLKAEDISRLIRAAAVMKLTTAAIWSKDGAVKLSAFDGKQTTRNTFDIEIGSTKDDFKMIILIDHLVKIMPREYTVKVASRGMIKLESDNLLYFIACEKESKYTKGE